MSGPAETLEFESRSAQRRWRRLIGDFEHAWRNLPADERRERRAELAAHVHDAMGEAAGDEDSRLRAAIAAYGPPPPAPPGWLPAAAQALHYAALPMIGCGALLATLLVALALSDLVPPHGAGLYLWPDGDFALSFERQAGARDLAGPAFAPTLLLIAAALTYALRRLWAVAVAPDSPAARLTRRDASPRDDLR